VRIECCEFLDICLVSIRVGGGPCSQTLRRRGIPGFCSRSIEGTVDGVLERDDGDPVRLDRLSDAASFELLSDSGPELSTTTVSGVNPEDSSDSDWNLLAIWLRAG
jgi:hypothetical protein